MSDIFGGLAKGVGIGLFCYYLAFVCTISYIILTGGSQFWYYLFFIFVIWPAILAFNDKDDLTD